MTAETWQERNERIVAEVTERLRDYCDIMAERDKYGRLTGNIAMPASNLLAFLKETQNVRP